MASRLVIAVALVLSLTGCGDAAPTQQAAPQAAEQASDIESSPTATATPTADPDLARAEEDPAPRTADQLTVLVFGDSISAAYGIKRSDGWAALLQQRLAQRVPDALVVNASVSGETTQGGRARLGAALARHQPDLVFLELGGNDALRGYPVDRMRDNLSAMVEMAKQVDAQVILLGMQIPPNYGPHYTRDFAAAFTTVAEATQARLVPFFLEGVALVDGMIQGDGIHPTTQAQPILLETGWSALTAALGEDYPSLLSAP